MNRIPDGLNNILPSMKVPPKRKGNGVRLPGTCTGSLCPSMKVPPKRKGNLGKVREIYPEMRSLNESPSEKEGKYWLYKALQLLMMLPQ